MLFSWKMNKYFLWISGVSYLSNKHLGSIIYLTPKFVNHVPEHTMNEIDWNPLATQLSMTYSVEYSSRQTEICPYSPLSTVLTQSHQDASRIWYKCIWKKSKYILWEKCVRIATCEEIWVLGLYLNFTLLYTYRSPWTTLSIMGDADK